MNPVYPLLVVPGLGAGPKVSCGHERGAQGVDALLAVPIQSGGPGPGQALEAAQVTEVDSEIGGEDGVLDHAEDSGVLGGAECVQDPVTVQVEDDEGLVEVVPLQGGARVELGQGGVGGQ